MRRATLFAVDSLDCVPISIHALHEESDPIYTLDPNHVDISIHALHEESDCSPISYGSAQGFQSTLSMRRATHSIRHAVKDDQFQSTLSMRRATKPRHTTARDNRFQSTLSMRRATPPLLPPFMLESFQSTLSMRRATASVTVASAVTQISIHALHEESDSPHTWASIARIYFNPRSP